MKKGFTLIELLAVIVILAIIALIVTPVISKVINGAKQRTAVVGSQNYVDSVNKTYALSMLDSKYDYLKDKDILETGFDDNELNEIEVSGKKPTYIKIEYDKTKNVVKEGKFCIDGISVDYINGVANKSENDYCNNLLLIVSEFIYQYSSISFFVIKFEHSAIFINLSLVLFGNL